ncbi:hypothetical protein OAO93_03730 [Balneolaceae bacterium]|jgi:spore coat polysaccharide biosynthesis protein SpsF|nr:hypothetical protein [Balneolaceae bacterium]
MVVGQLDKSVGMIIQARVSSSRLPGKVLMPFPFSSDKTILGSIIDDLTSTGASVVVATSLNRENDPIVNLCENNSIKCFRGSEDDVFSRFIAIQKTESFSTVFRFTADNPFIDLDKLNEFYKSFLEANVDYACSIGMPLGMNFELMKGSVLLELNDFELSQEEREHVTLIINRLDMFNKKIINLGNNAELRMTVDTHIDYAQASLLKSKLGKNCSLQRILDLKQKTPWIFELNQGVLQKNTSENFDVQIAAIKKICSENGYNKVLELLS